MKTRTPRVGPGRERQNNQDSGDVGQLTFERAIDELESIVKRLEDGKVPLEESVAIYERGEALKRRCEDLLRQAEARVEKITLDAAFFSGDTSLFCDAIDRLIWPPGS